MPHLLVVRLAVVRVAKPCSSYSVEADRILKEDALVDAHINDCDHATKVDPGVVQSNSIHAE